MDVNNDSLCVMTQLNDKDRAALMADMKSFDDEMPSIGIFWYNPQGHCLFDVDKTSCNSVSTIRMKDVEDAKLFLGRGLLESHEAGVTAIVDGIGCHGGL